MHTTVLFCDIEVIA